MNEPDSSARARLNELLRDAGQVPLDPEKSRRFEAYLSLILRWNSRTSLTSVRDVDGILTRHFIESIACARALPAGISNLLDFGSGAGLPGIPIALCRPEIAVTLSESQGKKAAFLQEAVRVLGIAVQVHAGRAETLRPEFDCVVLRAVDRMAEAVAAAAGLTKPRGWLALMTGTKQLAELKGAAGVDYSWKEPETLPFSAERILALGMRR